MIDTPKGWGSPAFWRWLAGNTRGTVAPSHQVQSTLGPEFCRVWLDWGAGSLIPKDSVLHLLQGRDGWGEHQAGCACLALGSDASPAYP